MGAKELDIDKAQFMRRTINFKFLLQPRQKYDITQYEELGFS